MVVATIAFTAYSLILIVGRLIVVAVVNGSSTLPQQVSLGWLLGGAGKGSLG